MKFRFEKNVLALLEGSIDIHIHSAPDVYPRLLNDVELALSAKENGMRAILVKNHYFETAGRAPSGSLIQTIGRCARHLNGRAILYADRRRRN